MTHCPRVSGATALTLEPAPETCGQWVIISAMPRNSHCVVQSVAWLCNTQKHFFAPPFENEGTADPPSAASAPPGNTSEM